MISAPFESTLDRPGMTLADPAAQFTFGTRWGDVNRIAFGALLCGFICFWLSIERRSPARVAMYTAFGAILGGATNFVTDSASDIIGLRVSQSAGMLGNIVANLAWCVLVPSGIAFTILFALGPTRQRASRARVAIFFGAVGSFVAQIAVAVMSQHFVSVNVSNLAATGGENASLSSFIPVWRMQEIAVGVVFGLAMAYADEMVRAGSVRLVLGKNEWREWSLDHAVNRIGSSEAVEIPIGKRPGVAPVHAAISRQGGGFVLSSQGAPVVMNGSPVPQVGLRNGDSFQLGDATLQFRAKRYVAVPATAPAAPSAPPSAPATPMPLAVLVDQAGGQFRLPPGEYSIGREPDNAISLAQDTRVSRYHAKIVVSPAGTQIADLGSTNGTSVNGQRIASPAALRPGDKVEIGSARFTVGQVS